jgi:hypothetical protein
MNRSFTTPCWFRVDDRLRGPVKRVKCEVICTGRTRPHSFGEMTEIILTRKNMHQLQKSSPFVWVGPSHFVNPEANSF